MGGRDQSLKSSDEKIINGAEEEEEKEEEEQVEAGVIRVDKDRQLRPGSIKGLVKEEEEEEEAIADPASSSQHLTKYTKALLLSAEDESVRSEKFETTKWELWAFYIYYIGNSGLGPFNFGPSQFQNLLYQQANILGEGNCGGDGQADCRLNFAGSDRTVQSVVLLCNGLSFAIQCVLFLLIGSFADFGTFRPYILMVSTVICIAISFGWLGVEDPSQWRIGIALYMIGLITYQLSLSYWTAAFPGLARNLPEMRKAREDLVSVPPTISEEEYEAKDSLTKNRVSNVAFAVCSAGELLVLAVMQGMLVGIHADRDESSNTKALSAVIAFSAGVWALCAIPWFATEKRRPGQKLPPGTTYLTAGLKQALLAAKHLIKLRQTLLYLVFYFLFSDALNTSVTVISTIQNDLVSFSTTKLNLLLIVGIAAQAVGIYGFWLIQKRWQLSTLYMLSWVILFTLILQVWGFVGIFTSSFGFHRVWEIYAYQAYYGLLVCPWYAYSQTMISQVCPKGYEFMFFSLFSLVGKTSAFIGPFVTQAISDRTGNASSPFYFLLSLGVVSTALLLPLDVRKSSLEQASFLAGEMEDKGQEGEL
ncbi:hypothetical protein IE53DRAFT_310603 [Violaceomyces palustris]|uniref:Uncharacterized protein n=1 Tax=Violaceomyces palustris TaxID=1673888 RepID=A0ACD0P5K3_9BASI|nr:hypothetical protein IE53DRAFT_310603 [Violaceomyces palustris]